MSEYLFAYGTLRPGLAPESIAGLVARLLPIGEGSVSGRLYDLGEYPGAVLEANCAARIPGIVLRLRDGESVLEALDAYEGFEPDCVEASLFRRRRCAAMLAGGDALVCWIYEYNRPVEGRRLIDFWPAAT